VWRGVKLVKNKKARMGVALMRAFLFLVPIFDFNFKGVHQASS
jgi:hypothetical protein